MRDIGEWTGQIHHGDAFKVLEELPAESIHAVVTDPPYGIDFMRTRWIDDDSPAGYQEWCRRWATKAKRVLKPGGHLLAFGGDRTWHRLASGIGDAGFVFRKLNCWIHGSGFPKGVSPEQQIPWPRENPADYRFHTGFKSEQKPAIEPIALVRKPLDGTVAENVMQHGTGALNIDGTRIPTDEDTSRSAASMNGANTYGEYDDLGGDGHNDGRYPSNLVLDQQAARMLDAQSGSVGGNTGTSGLGRSEGTIHSDGLSDAPSASYDDTGGASRFFYTSKASKSERTLDGAIENAHPTVKPVDLMEWLVKLATAEGQVVLDPFAGTGTTCRAAKNKHREFVGVEQQANWADVARARCGLDVEDPSVLRDGVDAGLEAFADD